MFTKILQWIQEQIGKMLNTSTVKDALKIDVAMSPEMTTALQKWALMYVNQASWLSDEKKSLNLPAAIAGEIARAVTIEMDVEISGSARAKWLELQMENALKNIRQNVEFGVAKGGLMMKPYIAGDTVAVDFVQADCFYPVSFDANGHITACVFSDTKIMGRFYYTRLEYHQMTSAGCQITNSVYKADSKDTLGRLDSLSSVPAWAELQPEATITNIPRPLFAYFRYPQANNIDPTSPLGVSGYARAVELIEQADGIWGDLLWEFESGKRALYVDELALGKDTGGKAVLANRRLFRTLNVGGAKDDFFEEWSPTLREQNYINGLDAVLKKIELSCGLAYGTLSDPNTVDRTATEIISSKQRSAATIVDCQKALEDALEDLLYAVDVWGTLGNLAPRGAYEAAYHWDDSIVTDSVAQFAQDSQAIGLQVMSKVKFLMRNYGMTEEMAKKEIAQIQAENMGGTDFFTQPAGDLSTNNQMMQKQPAV